MKYLGRFGLKLMMTMLLAHVCNAQDSICENQPSSCKEKETSPISKENPPFAKKNNAVVKPSKDIKPKKEVSVKADSDEKVSSQEKSKKLYQLFNKSYIKTIEQIQCLKDIKCINSEDDVLKYSIYNIKLLNKLDNLTAKNDLWAMYYRGLIAYERAMDYADRASYIRDRDFIFTAMVLNRKRDEQFQDAKKFFTQPAVERYPEACQYMGNIYANGYGTKVNRDLAMDFYYCAAIEYLDANRSLEAQIVLKVMTETADPTDARTVDVYAKVNKNIR